LEETKLFQKQNQIQQLQPPDSTENSQAITVINPGNPVGAVLDREDVAAWLGLGVVGMGFSKRSLP